jgi:hypothetical protein
MGYTPGDIGGVNPGGWYDTYDGKLAGWEAEFQSDVANQLWSGTGNVFVANMMGQDSQGNYTVHSQDQLVRASHTPEPISAVVWSVLGIGAIGVTQLRRKR